jgi:hypothetical protein
VIIGTERKAGKTSYSLPKITLRGSTKEKRGLRPFSSISGSSNAEKGANMKKELVF